MEVYGLLASGYGDWPIIKQIAWLLGQVMNGIFNVLSAIGIENIGVCIIIFTIIIYTLMIPLTIKQQKFSKMSAVMQPEIKKIQKKYQGKTDQASMLKQQEEMNMVYEKYGTSMTGGCLPMLIQMPILFALYPVIRDIPTYVKGVKDVYLPVTNAIMATDGFQKIMETIGSASPVAMSAKSYDYSQVDTIVNALYKFQDSTWNTLLEKMPNITDVATQTMEKVTHLNSFLGINIGEQPLTQLTTAFHSGSVKGIILAVIIPVLAGLTQFISVKLQPTTADTMDDKDNPMASSMKTMTYTMPLISVVFGFTLPAGLGLYWAASAAVRCVQQLAINKYLNTKSLDDMIAENQKKAQKKREKHGAPAKEINKMATTSTRNVGTVTKGKSGMNESEREAKIQQAQQKAQNSKPGSLASKANMVTRYNQGLKTEEKKPEQPAENSKGKKKK